MATFHPSEFILEEMAERKWGRDMLAKRMIRDDRDSYGITRLALDFYLDVGPEEPKLSIGKTSSSQLGFAFGVDGELFLRLHQSWLGSYPFAPAKPAPEPRSGARK